MPRKGCRKNALPALENTGAAQRQQHNAEVRKKTRAEAKEDTTDLTERVWLAVSSKRAGEFGARYAKTATALMAKVEAALGDEVARHELGEMQHAGRLTLANVFPLNAPLYRALAEVRGLARLADPGAIVAVDNLPGVPLVYEELAL